MSSPEGIPLPEIRLRPSRRLLRYTALLYLAVAMVALWLPWPVLPRLGLFILILADGAWRRRTLRRIHGLQALRVGRDRRLQVLERDGERWIDAEPRPPCHLLPGLAILHLRRDGRTHSCLLEPAMMGSEEWRRLRVWMKWGLPELLPQRERWYRRLLSWWLERRSGG